MYSLLHIIAPKLSKLENSTVLLGVPLEISFAVDFIGFVDIRITRLTDAKEYDVVSRNINNETAFIKSLGNTTNADESCFRITVSSGTSSGVEDKVCVTVIGPPEQPVDFRIESLDCHRIRLIWSSRSPINPDKHETVRGFIVHVKYGNYSETQETTLQTLIVPGIPSCTAVNATVAARGNRLVSKPAVASVIHTDLQPPDFRDIRLYYVKTGMLNESLVMYSLNDRERKLMFRSIPTNETVLDGICTVLWNEATHMHTDNTTLSEVKLDSTCWETTFDFVSKSQTLVEIFTMCPNAMECDTQIGRDVGTVCIDTFKHKQVQPKKPDDDIAVREKGGDLSKNEIVAITVPCICIIGLLYWRRRQICSRLAGNRAPNHGGTRRSLASHGDSTTSAGGGADATSTTSGVIATNTSSLPDGSSVFAEGAERDQHGQELTWRREGETRHDHDGNGQDHSAALPREGGMSRVATSSVPASKRRKLDDIVNDDEIAEVAGHIESDWGKVAARLDPGKFSQAAIRVIKRQDSSLFEQAREMLEQWKNSYDTNATRSRLRDAMVKAGFKRQARIVFDAQQSKRP
ncbi:uncharacterized protein LOC134177402 isoform X2 [Corticium candelabrum]|uniref:uncharacterized protein LOC134177402 isoform X2 n=1 Tax=Corticium candelabrum TaxID=121492 RepID=UPI002E2560B3|nr:uncharacterized protein LOC134177402 isoform X2 [Corticium candelabrum]